jgi:1,4-alpha-glucan branching enzyme
LEFTHPTALKVCVAGTFNDWRPEATPMVLLAEGRWRKDLVLPPGDYEYRLVVDGDWIEDPLATQAVPNPFGGSNSVVRVPSPRSRAGVPKGVSGFTPGHADSLREPLTPRSHPA